MGIKEDRLFKIIDGPSLLVKGTTYEFSLENARKMKIQITAFGVISNIVSLVSDVTHCSGWIDNYKRSFHVNVAYDCKTRTGTLEILIPSSSEADRKNAEECAAWFRNM